MDLIVTVEEGQSVMVCINLLSSGSTLGYSLTVDLDVTDSAKAGSTHLYSNGALLNQWLLQNDLSIYVILFACCLIITFTSYTNLFL